MSTRRTHSPKFKALAAMEDQWPHNDPRNRHLSRRLSHSGQPVEWQMLDFVNELLTRRKTSEDKEKSKAKKAELFQQIGKLQMELEWLKKISAALMPVNCKSGFDPGNPELSISRQCALLGLHRSTH